MTAGPYVPWFHGDFLRATQGWTLTERGVYWMLLCAEWESGPLPDDPVRLASIVGLDAQAFAAAWQVVGRKFLKNGAGLLNERMETHRGKFAAWRQRLSEGGTKGMRSRYGKAAKIVGLPAVKDAERRG